MAILRWRSARLVPRVLLGQDGESLGLLRLFHLKRLFQWPVLETPDRSFRDPNDREVHENRCLLEFTFPAHGLHFLPNMLKRLVPSLFGCLLGACGASAHSPPVSNTDSPDLGADYVLKTPTVTAVAPGTVQVGDTVTILGSNFVDPVHGTLSISFDGSYTDQTGATKRTSQEVPIIYDSPGIAHFTFGPRVIFSDSGDQIGDFTGEAQVINHLNAALAGGVNAPTTQSNKAAVAVSVTPSVMVEYLRAAGQGCQAITSATIGGQNLAVGLRAIGIPEATTDQPIAFKVRFDNPTLVSMFQGQDGVTKPTVAAAPAMGQVQIAKTITSGRTLMIDPTVSQDTYQITPPLTVGMAQYSSATLTQLQSGAVSQPVGYNIANFSVEMDAGSVTAQQIASIRVYNLGEVRPYDGNTKLIERFPPDAVTACISGGDIGRDITYSEGSADTEERSVTLNSNVTSGGSVGVDIYFQANVNWAQTFGYESQMTSSTEQTKSLNLTAHIVPFFNAVCYRQREQIERSVSLVYYDACGVSTEAGKATLTDWNWGFDIASGLNCPPPSNLPPGQKFQGQ